jgi:hypothetical protein
MSEKFENCTEIPFDRIINRWFLTPDKSSERSLVDLITEKKNKDFDIADTKFFYSRTGQKNWDSPEYANLPADLDGRPIFYVTPWYAKIKEWSNVSMRVKQFPETYNNFLGLMDSILLKGYDSKYAQVGEVGNLKQRRAAHFIDGWLLSHPEKGDMFIYRDGNRRLGILSYLRDQGIVESNISIPVHVSNHVKRETLLQSEPTRTLIKSGWLTADDAYKWFDHAFVALEEKCNDII